MDHSSVKAIWNGAVLAESNSTEVVEGNQYFPADSIKREYFQPSATHVGLPVEGHRVVLHRRRRRQSKSRRGVVLSRRRKTRRKTSPATSPSGRASRSRRRPRPTRPISRARVEFAVARDRRRRAESARRRGDRARRAHARRRLASSQRRAARGSRGVARGACDADADVRGATMYVTLEPHDHRSTMPPCSRRDHRGRTSRASSSARSIPTPHARARRRAHARCGHRRRRRRRSACARADRTLRVHRRIRRCRTSR